MELWRHLARQQLRNATLISHSRPLSVLSQTSRPFSSKPTSCGLLVDIDGVLTRGCKRIEEAVEGFRRISDPGGNLTLPVVFLTNGSYRSEYYKARVLSKMLEVNISSDQIVLVNSPLRQFTSWHDKNVFFAGQGAQLNDLAKDLGFQKPVVLSDIISDIPMFDVVDHSKRLKLKSGSLPDVLPPYFPIDCIVIANTPIKWDAHIQILLDILLTGGTLRDISPQQTPLLACNPDLVWAAEYHLPRLANGAFVHMLASLYQEMAGKELDITWCGKPTKLTYDYGLERLREQAELLNVTLGDVYGIGDNVDVDIVGANRNNVKSVLVCTGLYQNKDVILERNIAVLSRRASITEPITAAFVARDIGVFLEYILEKCNKE